MYRGAIGRVWRWAARGASFVGVGVSLLVLLLSCCKWDKQLPFRGNELDLELVGFWLRVEKKPNYDRRKDSVGEVEMIEFRRDQDCYYRLRHICPFEGFGRVVCADKEPVYTKGGHLYAMYDVDTYSHFLGASPYRVWGDSLRVGDCPCGTKYYARVVDTSTVDWAVRRVIKNAKRGE